MVELWKQGRWIEVLNAPQHPYTQLLIQAIPRPDPTKRWQAPLDRQRDEMGRSGGGSGKEVVPFSLVAPLRMERCREAVPPLYETAAGTRAAGYLYEQERAPLG